MDSFAGFRRSGCVALFLWIVGVGLIIPCACADLIATVREDGLSLFRSLSRLDVGLGNASQLYEGLLHSAGDLNGSSYMHQWLNTDVVGSHADAIRSRLLAGGSLSGPDAFGIPEVVFFSLSRWRPVLVIRLNRAGEVSRRSFLVNRFGVFPIHSLQGSGYPVPAVQLLQFEGVWYPILAGTQDHGFSNLDNYLSVLCTQIEQQFGGIWESLDSELYGLIDWSRRLRFALASLPRFSYPPSSQQQGTIDRWVDSFRLVVGSMQNIGSVDPFLELVRGAGVPDRVLSQNLSLDNYDFFGRVLAGQAYGFETFSSHSELTISQMLVMHMRTTQNQVNNSGQGHSEPSARGVPIVFNEESAIIDFDGTSYLHQLLLVLHMRCQLLQFARQAALTFLTGMDAELRKGFIQEQRVLIDSVHALIHALGRTGFPQYWGDDYYRPVLIVSGDVVLFNSDQYAPLSGWKDQLSGH